jgi:2-oxo-4-hydroxy-4-carboxy-5-ureidoimidazoline decarboxylase
MNLAEVNGLGLDPFVARLGGVFEHSPWVAREAWKRRPFASVDALFGCMREIVQAAAEEKRLALIRAHPELAGREASQGALAAESSIAATWSR